MYLSIEDITETEFFYQWITKNHEARASSLVSDVVRELSLSDEDLREDPDLLETLAYEELEAKLVYAFYDDLPDPRDADECSNLFAGSHEAHIATELLGPLLQLALLKVNYKKLSLMIWDHFSDEVGRQTTLTLPSKENRVLMLD